MKSSIRVLSVIALAVLLSARASAAKNVVKVQLLDPNRKDLGAYFTIPLDTKSGDNFAEIRSKGGMKPSGKGELGWSWNTVADEGRWTLQLTRTESLGAQKIEGQDTALTGSEFFLVEKIGVGESRIIRDRIRVSIVSAP
jgi:hypothetical protein